MKTEKEYPNYVGRKMIGFKFNDGTDDIRYQLSMNDFIDQIGIIEKMNSDAESVGVRFNNGYWNYPISMVEQHLVKDCEIILEEAMNALDDFLNAGSKEARQKAAEKAKQLYEEYHGTPYKNRNER